MLNEIPGTLWYRMVYGYQFKLIKMKTKILIWAVFALSSISTVLAQTALSDPKITITGENSVPATFTGTPVATSVLGLMDTTATLSSGTNYTLNVTFNGSSVSQFLDAGTYTATFTGAGTYTGTKTTSITIAPADINGATITIADKEFTGTTITPATTDISSAMFSSYTLTTNDYTIGTASNNVNVGTASVMINGTANFTGSKAVNFTITPANISSANIAIADKVFTGQNIQLEPASDITATLGTYQLTASDMTLGAYSSNRDAGTASVTITGSGNFTGTVNSNFTITPAPLNTVNVVFDPTSYEYTGSQIAPTYKVMLNGVELLPTDYTAVLGANMNAGPTAGVVTLQASTNLTGSNTDFTFEITPLDLSTAVITMAPDTFDYSGSAIQPLPTSVVLGAVTLTTSDYSIDYSTNTDAGIAGVVVTGTGNYTGQATKTFVITKPLSNAEIRVIIPNQMYTGSPVIPANIIVLDQTKKLVLGVDYQIKNGSLTNNTDRGVNTASLIIEAAPGSVYTGETDSVYFSILNNVTPDPELPSPGIDPGAPDPGTNPPAVYHNLVIPSVSGMTTTPEAGTYPIFENTPLAITITVDSIVSGLLREVDEIVYVFLNDEAVTVHSLGNGVYRVDIDEMREDITVRMFHRPRGTTGNEELQDGVAVYSGKGIIYVRANQNENVMIYSISGQLKAHQQVNEQLTSFDVSQGLYIVKVGETAYKVIVK